MIIRSLFLASVVAFITVQAGCGSSQRPVLVRDATSAQPVAVATTAGSTAGLNSSNKPKFPVPVVYLSGSPSEMGTGHGQALGGTVRMLHEKYLMVFLAGGS